MQLFVLAANLATPNLLLFSNLNRLMRLEGRNLSGERCLGKTPPVPKQNKGNIKKPRNTPLRGVAGTPSPFTYGD